MSFNTSLSGINAANSDLNVTANNIANVNTTGFKESRAEFADLFSYTTYGYNLLGMVDQKYNKRLYLLNVNNYRADAASVALNYEYKF